MRKSTLVVLIALLLAGPAIAGPVFQTPAPGGVSALRSFATWVGSPGGAAVVNLYPELASMRSLDFSRPESLGALSPLLARLKPETLKELESIAESSPGRQQSLVMTLESARSAGSEVAGNVLLEAFKNQPDWESLQSEVTAVGVYGDWGKAAQKVVDQKVAAVSAKRTGERTQKIADKLSGASNSKILKVEDNVVYVDFGKGNFFSRRQAGPEVEPTWEVDPAARKPSPAMRKRYTDLKRQVTNAEVLMESELGDNGSKIMTRLRSDKQTAQARMRVLEMNFPQLKGDGNGTISPARLAASRPPFQGREVTADMVARFKTLHREARELELHLHDRSAMWKLLLTGRMADYREVKKHPLYSVPAYELRGKLHAKTSELDTMRLYYPGIAGVAANSRDNDNGNGAHKKQKVDWTDRALMALAALIAAPFILQLVVGAGVTLLGAAMLMYGEASAILSGIYTGVFR